jgi:hypothetical protein
MQKAAAGGEVSGVRKLAETSTQSGPYMEGFSAGPLDLPTGLVPKLH